MAGIYVGYNLSVPLSNYTNNYPRDDLQFYEQIRDASPGQHFAFLVWPPVYLTRNWPVEVAIEDASRGQWGETVHRLREGCMKFSPATQRKFISVKSKAVCDQKPRAFDRELSLKQSQSPTGLADQGHAHSLFCGQGDSLAFSGKSQSSADHENPEVLEPSRTGGGSKSLLRMSV